MALIKCKECGTEIAKSAKMCPQCGAPNKKNVGVFGWLFVLFFVLPFAWSIGSQMGTSPTVAATVSSATTTNQPAAAKRVDWSKNEFKDTMTDTTTTVVSVKSLNSTPFEFPYNKSGGSHLTLSFRKNGSDFDAYLRIEKGQMLCNYSKCGFNLRVGDGAVQKWTGLESTTHDSDLMFVRDARQIETIVKSGKPFRIGIEFFQAGERVFEFDPAGYPGI
jgi:hypothetical protein